MSSRPEHGRVIGLPKSADYITATSPRSVIAVAAQRGARPGAVPVSAKQNEHLLERSTERNAKLQGDGRDWSSGRASSWVTRVLADGCQDRVLAKDQV